MDSAEYSNLEQIERDHWYYSGKREIVRGWLERLNPGGATGKARLLDYGAGTGIFAREMKDAYDVHVLDDHEESLRMLRVRFAAQNIHQPDRGMIPQPAGAFDALTALDVLEHVPDDAAVVREFHRVLRPGGVAVITVPASMALWSDWDVSLHHFRRYHRRQLASLFPAAHWETEYLNYTNVAAYPAVWLLRKGRKVFPAKNGKARPEDRPPPRMLNAILKQTFVRPATWRVPFPFGVSLLLVARRR